MDSDKIVVMNLGKVEEFGAPYELLDLPLGILKEMVNTVGADAQNLRKIAKEKYDAMKQEQSS